MTKLFRTIRQKMLTDNKVSKYLLYAIGEIILVVIGILIALQINNWNQQRKDSNQEVQILTQLLNEYNSNLEQLKSKISLRNGMIKSSLWILDYRKFPDKNINIDSFDIHISRILTTPTFDPELGVTNELINSGKLYYITNSELRKNITAFPSFLEQLREEELSMFNLIENKFIPFLITNYQIGPIVEKYYINNNFNSTQLLNNTNRVSLSKNLFTNGKTSSFLNHNDTEDYLALILTSSDFTNLQSLGVENQIKLIISTLKQELNENNNEG